MAPKAIINDFHNFVGTLLFVLFVLVLLGGPAGSLTVPGSTLRAGLSGLLLVLSLYVLRSGEAGSDRRRRSSRPVLLKSVTHREVGGGHRASAA